MGTNTSFDMIVLGGGPAGSRAALHSAAQGMRTALVEPAFLGGSCLNSGCIPTKFLLGSTSSLPLFDAQKIRGAACGELPLNLPALQAEKNTYLKMMRAALEERLHNAGVTLFKGRGVFAGPRSLQLSGTGPRLDFERCIVAVGSTPAVFPGISPDGKNVLAAATLLNLKAPPEHLLLIGGGAIGVELGELFHRLGSRITMVDAMPRILPGEDPETSAFMQDYFTCKGWEIHTEKHIDSVMSEGEGVLLRMRNGPELRAQKALIAVGRRSPAASLQPEKAGLALTEHGWLATDAYLRASDTVYAVGDINGRALLANAADNQARYAAAHASGDITAPYQPSDITTCIYGTMEIMRVGPTREALRKQGVEPRVSRVNLEENPIAQGCGQPEGFIVMFWQDDVLRTITTVGHAASHMGGAAALLVRIGIRRGEPFPAIFAHPTLDQLLEAAVLAPLTDGHGACFL